LQHRGDHAGFIEIVAIGIVAAGIELGQQEDVLRPGHRGFQRGHGFFTTDKQRHDHAGEHHDVAQGSRGYKVISANVRPTCRTEPRPYHRYDRDMGAAPPQCPSGKTVGDCPI
jgi:hypothetical protein